MNQPLWRIYNDTAQEVFIGARSVGRTGIYFSKELAIKDMEDIQFVDPGSVYLLERGIFKVTNRYASSNDLFK